MSKHSKTLEKLLRSPTPSDIRWSDLVSLMSSFGYLVLNGNGSRRKFFHPETKHILICHEPHPGPHVQKYAIEQIVQGLTQQGLIG